jgi:hypothetical protein
MRNAVVALFAMAMTLGAAAQVSAPPPNPSGSPGAPAYAGSAQPSASLSDTSANYGQLNQLVQNSRVDLARLRIEKWKTDSGTKRQAEANSESIQRNLTAALPTVLQQARSNPASVAATFKLYRNLNALYDVMSTLTETAGAFGSKEEYQALANDTANLDTLRRSLADQVERMAVARDNEVAQLQSRARQTAASPAAAAPKKIVVDDTEPAKKTTKKSAATTTKKKTAAANEQTATTPPK